ncbi:hypothetical protein B0T10DRAFT_460583 [Thelonectria olida]|uniref:Ribonuclease PIN domain-containing protein n=1 Tax=Thelonectria olida TaxID=1576542 RepID=A0A9P8W1T0_9HYPO|nr:hypothetical protein B0T10DRAFT_460583 [Thelonectria olida]
MPEIHDAATRSRIQTTLLPFVTVRAPKPAGVKFISTFTQRTGNREVLSKSDLEVLALTYEPKWNDDSPAWVAVILPSKLRLLGLVLGLGLLALPFPPTLTTSLRGVESYLGSHRLVLSGPASEALPTPPLLVLVVAVSIATRMLVVMRCLS